MTENVGVLRHQQLRGLVLRRANGSWPIIPVVCIPLGFFRRCTLFSSRAGIRTRARGFPP
ncbi:MAG: hypothetical protein AUI63_00690 [Gemmatimonadetes bacterium 13_1_40CM_2_60_3]|nr:MAG: hypothetical protein AUI63_00690 [Gemmatimonadetes bacterium 13_1_40CM_2_60_3]